MDQTKEDLLKKLQASISEKRGSEGDKALLSNDIQHYQRQLLVKD